MPSVRVDVISIGTLDRNLLWREQRAVRTAHATCSLVRAGDRTIVVDPGLPPAAIAARLHERTGLTPDRVDTIVLTCFLPAHRRGAGAFPHARVLLHQLEIEHARRQIERLFGELADAERHGDVRDEEGIEPEAADLRAAAALLDRAESAEDSLVPGVDVFPLPGHTPGTCGLLVTSPTLTTLLSGPAVPSLDHFLAAQVLPDAIDRDAAGEAVREAYEIADVVIPGYDNAFASPRQYAL